MIEQFAKLSGLKKQFNEHLNDPVNWVAFIRRYDMDEEEQKFWRDHLELEHIFDGEIEA